MVSEQWMIIVAVSKMLMLNWSLQRQVPFSAGSAGFEGFNSL
jgi:hypothetical protein